MGRFLKVVGVLVLVVAAVAVWKREGIARLMAVNSLFSAERIVGNFSNMDRLFLTRALSRGEGAVSPLPQGVPTVLPAEVEAWIAARNVTALVVLKDGKIVHES